MQVYTLGRTSSYDRNMWVPGGSLKGGRQAPQGTDPGYEGGWIWLTAQEAEDYRTKYLRSVRPDWKPEEFSVYAVEVHGFMDLEELPDHFELLRDRPIVGKVSWGR
jgi:hypothetical protein